MLSEQYAARLRIRFGREQHNKKKARVVQQILEKVEQKLNEGEVKATLGDYIRLVQLQKELEEEEPAEITVKWVEGSADRKEDQNEARTEESKSET